MPPSAARIAYDALLATGELNENDVVQPFQEVGKFGDASFRVRVPVPANSVGLPSAVDLELLIPATFPMADVAVVPVGSDLHGFAHQEGLSGKLCLPTDRHRPPKAKQRLLSYLHDAKTWVSDAAAGRLLLPGDWWELPDFRIDRWDNPPRVYSLEVAESLDEWLDQLGGWGTVQFAGHVATGLVPVRFEGRDGFSFEPEVGAGFVNRRASALGTWLLLPSHILERHRPARSFAELESQCQQVGIDIWAVLRRALKAPPHAGFHFLLVGAPIPEKVGGPDQLIHWQPIAFPHKVSGPLSGGKKKRGRGTLRARLRGLVRNDIVPWGDQSSAAQATLNERGVLDETVRASKVCVIGCGAIGSMVADHLARGAVNQLAIFDSQDLELENLARHSLGTPDIGSNKALAQARRLNGMYPGAHVRGFGTKLPISELVPRSKREAQSVLSHADVLIDCTANDVVFDWLSKLGRATGRTVIHVFTNAHARMLTICASGKHASCKKVCALLDADIDNNKTPFTPAEYSPTEEIRPGFGCWSSTFPARGHNVAALVATAIPIIEQLISEPRQSRGAAVVLRRKEPVFESAALASLVEVAWFARCR